MVSHRIVHCWLLNVIVLLLLITAVVDSSTTTTVASSLPRNNDGSCSQVKQVYTVKGIGPLHDVPDNKLDGSNLTECSSELSCCTPSMEEGYRNAVKTDFWIMLQSSSADLKSLLHSSTASFRENFLSMIEASRNNTEVLFSEVYKQMNVVAREPVSQLYSDLTSYILGEPSVDLDTKTRSFFDKLFPLVYHHSINPKLKDFSEEYKECLRQTQREIAPFGDIPDRLASHLTKSFGTARTVLDSLVLAIEVVNSTDHMVLGDDCVSGLVRLVYCAHCKGYVNTKPCSGYCLNVVRGCLASVAELDQPLIDFINSLERLTSGLVSSYNIEEVLGMLDTKISEAIMFAMENGPELSKRVKVACGHPRRASREVTEPSTSDAGSTPGRIVPVRTREGSFHVRLQQLVAKLTETKGQYANLADVLCSDDSWAVRKEGRCWNGKALGEYTKTIAGVGVAAQRYNPEIPPPKEDDVMVKNLGAKLEAMSRLLKESIAPERPQSDSYMIEGSGSGGWTRTNRIAGGGGVGTVSDDEDYDDRGSGSGDWGGPKSSDFNFDSGDVRHSNVNIKIDPKASSSSHITVGLVLELTCLLAILLRNGPFSTTAALVDP